MPVQLLYKTTIGGVTQLLYIICIYVLCYMMLAPTTLGRRDADDMLVGYMMLAPTTLGRRDADDMLVGKRMGDPGRVCTTIEDECVCFIRLDSFSWISIKCSQGRSPPHRVAGVMVLLPWYGFSKRLDNVRGSLSQQVLKLIVPLYVLGDNEPYLCTTPRVDADCARMREPSRGVDDRAVMRIYTATSELLLFSEYNVICHDCNTVNYPDIPNKESGPTMCISDLFAEAGQTMYEAKGSVDTSQLQMLVVHVTASRWRATGFYTLNSRLWEMSEYEGGREERMCIYGVSDCENLHDCYHKCVTDLFLQDSFMCRVRKQRMLSVQLIVGGAILSGCGFRWPMSSTDRRSQTGYHSVSMGLEGVGFFGRLVRMVAYVETVVCNYKTQDADKTYEYHITIRSCNL